MSFVWTTLLKMALSLAITAVGKIKPEDWAKLAIVIQAWLARLQNVLPAGNPLITILSGYKAPLSKMSSPHADSTDG